MSQGNSCDCACPTVDHVDIPGTPGADATPIAPDTVNPEGVKVGNPGQTYLNSATESFWVKKTGTGNTGWINLIAGAA